MKQEKLNRDGDICFVCALVKHKAVKIKRINDHDYRCPECGVYYNQNVCDGCGKDIGKGLVNDGPRFWRTLCEDCRETKEIIYVCSKCGHEIGDEDVVIKEVKSGV
jgi:rRNA maturation endonuclease Nob1